MPPNSRRVAAAWAAALALLGLLLVRYHPLEGEDFMYYYCAGWVERRGDSMYDPAAFQACVSRALGHENRHLASAVGSAYPPSALALFRPLAALPFNAAFALWTVLVGAGALALLRLYGDRPPAPLLIVAHPGFVLSLAYHKVTLILVPCGLWGLELARRGRDREGGALIGALCVQPHFLAAVLPLLALKRRWTAVGWALAAAAALAFAGGGLSAGAWALWAASAFHHARSLLTLDNQSLFAAWCKLAGRWDEPLALLEGVRAASMLAAAGAAVWIARRRTLEEAAGPWLALALLALPYSHGSDSLWTLPLYFQTIAAARERLRVSAGAAAAGALAVSAVLAALSGFYDPGHIASRPHQDLHGWLTIALLAAAAAAGRRPAGRHAIFAA